MKKTRLSSLGSLTFGCTLVVGSTALLAACADPAVCGVQDPNCDGVPDELGWAVYDSNGNWVQVDLNGDGAPDGPAVDTTGDGVPNAALLDTDNDGKGDALDFNGDRIPDQFLGQEPVVPGSGGVGGGGTPATGGADGGTTGAGATTAGTGGGAATGGGPSSGGCLDPSAPQSPSAFLAGQWDKVSVQRAGLNYRLIANGWGPNFGSHKINYNGTAFEIESMTASYYNENGTPASYPSVYCGNYSNTGLSGECGLPAPISSLKKLTTGLSWEHTGTGTEFNVAYDVWLGNNGNLTSYFMVWLRDPPKRFPAGNFKGQATVEGQQWDIYAGTVNVEGTNRPIINYVRKEGQDLLEFDFDMLNFFNDATQKRGLNLNGSEVMSVAIGFEIWNGPVSGLRAKDFCVDVQ